MRLNHPWTTLSRWSVEALSSMKLVLGENRLGPAVKTAVTLPGQKGLLSFSKHSSLLFCEALSSLHHMEFYHGSDQKATPGHFPFSHSTSIGTAFIQKSNLKDLTSKIPRQLSSVQFSCSVVSNSLRLHESQHARPPCPSATPGVLSDSRPSSQWCHAAISSSVSSRVGHFHTLMPFSLLPPENLKWMPYPP